MIVSIELKPDSFPCPLQECPPGPFLYKDEVGFKSEYGDAYCSSGEYFWAGTKTREERDRITVQPLIYETEKVKSSTTESQK